MKKIFTNILTLAALLITGVAFTACSSSDDSIVEQQPANPGEQVYTLTIKASKDGSATTRALKLETVRGLEGIRGPAAQAPHLERDPRRVAL